MAGVGVERGTKIAHSVDGVLKYHLVNSHNTVKSDNIRYDLLVSILGNTYCAAMN